MMLSVLEIMVIMATATLCLLILITVVSLEIKSVIRTWKTYDRLTDAQGTVLERHRSGTSWVEDREDGD